VIMSVEREVAWIAARMRELRQQTAARTVYECYCIAAAEWAAAHDRNLSNTYKAAERAYRRGPFVD
jgi:hypothetical protein